MCLVGRLRRSFVHMELIVDESRQGHDLQRTSSIVSVCQQIGTVKVAKSAGLGLSDLVVVRFGVLHRLQADGHDSERWRRQVFDDSDQVRLRGQSLHLTPADRLAQAL